MSVLVSTRFVVRISLPSIVLLLIIIMAATTTIIYITLKNACFLGYKKLPQDIHNSTLYPKYRLPKETQLNFALQTWTIMTNTDNYYHLNLTLHAKPP